MRLVAWEYLSVMMALVPTMGAAMVLPSAFKAEAPPIQQWAVRYNGTGNGLDWAKALAVDAGGNSYVTGYSWNGIDYDYATVKYNAAGVQKWVALYNLAPSHFEWANAIALDASGNCYVTGYGANGSGYNDSATVKYDAELEQQWVVRYHETNGATAIADSGATAIAVDASGNSYITGSSRNSGDYDYTTIKYNAELEQQWVALYNGTGNSADYAFAIALDPSGNSYVTGHSYNGSNDDYVTVKYNAAGIEQWVVCYNGTGNGDDRAQAIAVDASGNSYVTGYSWNGSNLDYAIVKYDAAGEEQWVACYNGTGNGDDRAQAIAVDASGNTYVTGYSWNGSNDDYATVKYNAAGVEQWVVRYNGTGNDADVATAIALDSNSNCYVTGYSWNGSNDDYATVKYNAAGVEQWVARYNGTGNDADVATAIALDSNSNCYVTGKSWNGSNYDYATVKYAQQPAVSAISPASGNQVLTENVTITGDYFIGTTSVSFGTGITVNTYHVDSATQITANISITSTATPGDRDVSVTTSGGTGTLTGSFTVYTSQPEVSLCNPNTGTRGQTENVAIMGNYFVGASAVSFSTGITVNNFTVNSDTQITATICIDSNATPGAHSVSVITPGGTGTLTGGFTVNAAPPPPSPPPSPEPPNPLIGTGGTTSNGGSSGTGTTSATTTVSITNIQTQSATLSARTVTPGTPVTVTADIINRSTVNGSKKVTLYVNGQVESTQGITVNSGGSSQLTYYITRSEPGDYSVYVDGVPAGSFKVELFRESDGILIFSIVMLAGAFLVGIIMLRRRQRVV